MTSNLLILLPGKDRFHDRVIPVEDISLQFQPHRPAGEPQTSMGPGVSVLMPDGSVEDHMFVINVREYASRDLKEFGSGHGFYVMQEGRPLDRHEELQRSSGARYIALSDGNVYCLRETAHQGMVIGYAHMLPLQINTESLPPRVRVLAER